MEKVLNVIIVAILAIVIITGIYALAFYTPNTIKIYKRLPYSDYPKEVYSVSFPNTSKFETRLDSIGNIEYLIIKNF